MSEKYLSAQAYHVHIRVVGRMPEGEWSLESNVRAIGEFDQHGKGMFDRAAKHLQSSERRAKAIGTLQILAEEVVQRASKPRRSIQTITSTYNSPGRAALEPCPITRYRVESTKLGENRATVRVFATPENGRDVVFLSSEGDGHLGAIRSLISPHLQAGRESEIGRLQSPSGGSNDDYESDPPPPYEE